MQKKFNMKAMIFAAGKGTRLKELTANKPKALVEVAGITLLERCILKLKDAGVNEIIINIHHYGEQIIDFVQAHRHFGISIDFSDERNKLLDTGGGLKKAADFFHDGKDFFIHNVDIISDINLQDMYRYHTDRHNSVTLAVRRRTSSRYFLFNKHLQLCGRQNIKTGECQLTDNYNVNTLTPYAFSGIHVVSPRIFEHFPTDNIFSVSDWYVQLAATQPMQAYLHNEGLWMDMGKIEDIHQLEQLIK